MNISSVPTTPHGSGYKLKLLSSNNLSLLSSSYSAVAKRQRSLGNRSDAAEEREDFLLFLLLTSRPFTLSFTLNMPIDWNTSARRAAEPATLTVTTLQLMYLSWLPGTAGLSASFTAIYKPGSTRCDHAAFASLFVFFPLCSHRSHCVVPPLGHSSH